ncbi:MAG TPA: dienelactone hydrolase family protein, partial [Phycisphaerales bacterium]|nr:dienelactone hydrolase family protein [Phycisphaerales bacterium]
AKAEQSLGFGKEMTDAHADWQLHFYGNAMHAFTNYEARSEEQKKMGIQYEEKADRRSWEAMQDFFREIFV